MRPVNSLAVVLLCLVASLSLAAAANWKSGYAVSNRAGRALLRTTPGQADAAAAAAAAAQSTEVISAAAAAGKPFTVRSYYTVGLGVASEWAHGKCRPNDPFVCSYGFIYYDEWQFNGSGPRQVSLMVQFSGQHVDEKNVTIANWDCTYITPPDTLLKDFKQVATIKNVRGAVDQVTITNWNKLAMPMTCKNYPSAPGEAPPMPNCTTAGLIVRSKAKCDTKKFRATSQCVTTSDVSVTSEPGGSCYPDAAASSVMAVVECDNGKRFKFFPAVEDGKGIGWGRTVVTAKA